MLGKLPIFAFAVFRDRLSHTRLPPFGMTLSFSVLVLLAALIFYLFSASERSAGLRARLQGVSFLRYVHPQAVLQSCALWAVLFYAFDSDGAYIRGILDPVDFLIGGVSYFAVTTMLYGVMLGQFIALFLAANIVISALLVVTRLHARPVLFIALLLVPLLSFMGMYALYFPPNAVLFSLSSVGMVPVFIFWMNRVWNIKRQEGTPAGENGDA